MVYYNLSANPKLTHLDCYEAGLSELDVTHNPILDEYSAFFDLENEYMNKHNERI